jgi:hypothetical protein
MMTKKMNKLSIDRLYSVSQPAKNSPGQCDEDADEEASLLHRRLVRAAAENEHVDEQNGHHHNDCDGPRVEVNLHMESFRDGIRRTTQSRRSLPPDLPAEGTGVSG